MLARLRGFAAAHRRETAAAAALVGIVAVVVAVAGGGGGGGPPKVSGTPAEVVQVVDSFQVALAGRDFATICDRLFSSRARAAAGGDNCQSVLAQAAAPLRRPRVRITSVAVAHGRAVVGVVASVRGHRSVADTIRLVRERGRFRIASAGSLSGEGE